MVTDPDGDFAVDVLVVGAGVQGMYVARSLQPDYSVCVVSDPDVEPETLDSFGYVSAGYDANDAARLQPARRAAGYWRLWAESRGVDHGYSPAYYAVAPAERVSRPRLWDDAALTYHDAPLPEIFSGGSLSTSTTYALDHDVVLHPATMLHEVTAGLESQCIEGRVVRFGLAGDAVDHVLVEVGGETVPIVARYVVLAAGIGNATLLGMISSRMTDKASRRDHLDKAAHSQAVRETVVVTCRGRGLPLLAGTFGGHTIVAHPTGEEHGVVWLVSPPVDDARTTLGGLDSRFDPGIDGGMVASTVSELFQMSPTIRAKRDALEWSTYVARRTQHPMLAVPDASVVGQPVPAKLETFDLDCFVALWPSHLGYSMILGDVVTERVREALGPRQSTVGLDVGDLAAPRRPTLARWERPAFPWRDWAAFAESYGLPA